MKKKAKQYKAVLRARIDFNYDEQHQRSLHPGGNYYLDKGIELKVSYNDIVNEVVRIIDNDLKPELQKYTTISIKEIQVQAIYEGSIEIIYTVILSLLSLVSGLKDLYDTVHLIREIAEKQINKKLSDRFGRHFRVDTYVITPENRDYWRVEEKIMTVRRENSVEQHDAFFYYLLVANIVLMAIVGVLVFGAVRAMYF